MNEINFLPETFVKTRAAKKRRWGHVVIALLVVGVIAAWWQGQRRSLAIVQARESLLEQEVGKAHETLAQVQRLLAERKVLAEKERVRRELAQSISHTAVLEMLGDLMPRSIAMTELTVVARRAPLRTAAEAKAAKSGGAKPAPVRMAVADEALLIEFSGLAPNDVEIAALVGALSDHRVFTQVKMLYSRSVTTRGVIGREFRLEMQVPLDRDYRPGKVDDPTQTQEVAHAG